MADPSPLTHEDFNSPDADTTIQSSDAILFKLHHKYLTVATGAFPGEPFNPADGEIIHLEEPGSVLEVLFKFIYPRRQAKLDGVEFQIVADLAEAAEKYEVFSAMDACERRLRDFLPSKKYAVDILVHALKHDHHALINEAALVLCLSPVLEIANMLPVNAILPWFTYKEAWKASLFDRATRDVRVSSKNYAECFMAASLWIRHLDAIQDFSLLKIALDDRSKNTPLPSSVISTISTCKCSSSLDNCPDINSVAANYRTGIKAVPPFTDFLEGKKDYKPPPTRCEKPKEHHWQQIIDQEGPVLLTLATHLSGPVSTARITPIP